MLYVMLVGAYPFERPEDKTDNQKLQKMIQVSNWKEDSWGRDLWAASKRQEMSKMHAEQLLGEFLHVLLLPWVFKWSTADQSLSP